MPRSTAPGAAHDPPDPDDDFDEDDDEDDDFDEGDDPDDGDENGDDGEDDGEPEDIRAGSSSAPADPAMAALASAAAAADVTHASPRRGWLPLTDPTIGSLRIQRRGRAADPTRLKYLRLYFPFPRPLRAALWQELGAGTYTLTQLDIQGKYLGSRTVRLVNGNGTDSADDFAASAPPPPAVPSPQPGTSWQVQAIATAGTLLTAVVTALVARTKEPAPAPARSQLGELRELIGLLQVTNADRADAFKQGLDAARLYLETHGSAGGGGDASTWAGIAQGVLEALRAPRAGLHTAPQGVTGNGASPAAPLLSSSAAAPAAPETREQLLERVIVAEIDRALRAGDGPETLCEVLEAWLPQHVLVWLTASEDADVLGELPKRFAAHAEYLSRPPVQQFLRSTLAMLREDAAAVEREHAEGPDGVPVSRDGAPQFSE